MMQKNIVVNSKEISLLKPITFADYESKTILTDSAWEYVELWLKRQKDTKSQEALFFWQQAKHFFHASECLPQNSKPLTSYYCCLNATKALLCINGINVKNISHGITQNRHGQSASNSLEKAEVIFLEVEFSMNFQDILEKMLIKRHIILKICYTIFLVYIGHIVLHIRVRLNYLFLLVISNMFVKIQLLNVGLSFVLILTMLTVMRYVIYHQDIKGHI